MLSKYLSNFWRTLDIPLINCEVALILTWSENCIITSKATRDASDDPIVLGVSNPTNATFKIKDTELYNKQTIRATKKMTTNY